MDQIIPGLWIGDLACALATDYLVTAGITHIVTAMKQPLPTPIKLPDGRVIDESHVFNIHLDDVENAPILVHFPGAVDFIDEALRQEWLLDEDAACNEDEHREPQSQDNQQDSSGRTHRPVGKGPGQWATMGEGTVLVHCHAGISRSVAVACAYLMHTRHMSADEALQLVKERRPIACPNTGFMHQLELYESAGFEVDVRHQRIRRFLMSQASILRGSSIDDVMLSYYPSPMHSPAASSSGSSTGFKEGLQFSPIDGSRSASPSERRKSRDTGTEVGKASLEQVSERVKVRRNSRAAASAAAARDSIDRLRSMSGNDSTSDHSHAESHPSTEGSEKSAKGEGSSVTRSRTRTFSSAALSKSPALGSNTEELFDRADEPEKPDLLTQELIKETFSSVSEPHEVKITVTNGSLPGGVARVKGNEGHAPYKGRPLTTEVQVRAQQAALDKLPKPYFGAQKLRCKKCRRELAARDHVIEHEPGRGKDAFDVRKREKDSDQKSKDGRAALGTSAREESVDDVDVTESNSKNPSQRRAADSLNIADSSSGASGGLKSAANLSASLPPHLAALRLGRAASSQTVPSSDTTTASPAPQQTPMALRKMLHSPLCTSYFVEPLAWMSALQNGEVAGRLDCPSTRCGAKLGSWDWAGMQCACGAWVTPAFALHRSKVDEA